MPRLFRFTLLQILLNYTPLSERYLEPLIQSQYGNQRSKCNFVETCYKPSLQDTHNNINMLSPDCAQNEFLFLPLGNADIVTAHFTGSLRLNG
jgi:hypothetical protein